MAASLVRVRSTTVVMSTVPTVAPMHEEVHAAAYQQEQQRPQAQQMRLMLKRD
jgi:hypothetical protein